MWTDNSRARPKQTNSLKKEMKKTLQCTHEGTGIIWECGGVMTGVFWGNCLPDNVDQVCCLCGPGEVDDWPATPAETPQEDNQKSQTRTKLQHNPRPWQQRSYFTNRVVVLWLHTNLGQVHLIGSLLIYHIIINIIIISCTLRKKLKCQEKISRTTIKSNFQSKVKFGDPKVVLLRL